MTERPAAHAFLYVHTDIPEGMTIKEWRAARAAAAGGAAHTSSRRAPRVLARPSMARLRVLGGRRRAPRRVAPPSPKVSP